jgi:RimJ/RimL family protein N-acetyltransferase
MDEIKTRRLLLRPMRITDREDLFAVFGDPRVMRYWSTLPHTDAGQTEALIRETISADPATTAEFAIEYQGRAIGKAGFWRMPEIGFLLHPDFWQHGFGTEALQALIAYGFGQRRLDKITADVDPDNAASLGLLRKLGFEETGRAEKTLQIGDAWFDSVYLERRSSQVVPT